MKKARFLFLIFPLAVLNMSMSGSKKSSERKAGSEGDVSLRLEQQHYAFSIYSSANYSDIAYIKFFATDFPGPSPFNFDMIVAGKAGKNFVNVPGLKSGQYFLMMTGLETSATWNLRVIGGLPLNFSKSSGKKQLSFL